MTRKSTRALTVPAIAAPAHPGEVVRRRLEAAGFTVTEAAIELGISRQRLQAVLSGRAAISPALADGLAYALGGSPESWLDLQGEGQAFKILEESDQLAPPPPPPEPAVQWSPPPEPPVQWSPLKLVAVLIVVATGLAFFKLPIGSLVSSITWAWPAAAVDFAAGIWLFVRVLWALAPLIAVFSVGLWLWLKLCQRWPLAGWLIYGFMRGLMGGRRR